MLTSPLRIAMWSGPRNISTAMMRSFGNRTDTHVVDEPFYAAYLAATGYDHPGRDEILGSQSRDWRAVVTQLTGALPPGKQVWYQKHMTHHMLEAIDTRWMLGDEFRHVFLIREPRRVLASLARVLGDFSLAQTGFPQQAKLWRMLRQQTGQVPLVVDAADVLKNPRHTLTQLCQQLELPFQEEMLHWPEGPRSTDGVWGPHWYRRLYATTGFAVEQDYDEPLPESCKAMEPVCRQIYEELAACRLR